MRRVTVPLIGLEHIVCPTIELDEIQIWLQCAGGIIDITKRRSGWAGLRAYCAFYLCSSIRRARAALQVAHCAEGLMIMTKIITKAERNGLRVGRAGARGLIQPPLCWMLYCWGPGLVLQALGLLQSPWKKLSGVRFSWMTRMMCWKAVIWAEAGVARPSAVNVNGISLFTTLPPRLFYTAHNMQRSVLRQERLKCN